MKRRWKQLPRDHVRGQWAALYVTLNPKGQIAMSRVTWERLGGPKAVNIWFDDVNNCVGLKPCAEAAKDAYKFTHIKPYGARRLSAFRLMQEFSIKINQTVQFHDAEIDYDGVLVLDLRSARVSSRAVNHWRTRDKRTGEERSFPTSTP